MHSIQSMVTDEIKQRLRHSMIQFIGRKIYLFHSFIWIFFLLRPSMTRSKNARQVVRNERQLLLVSMLLQNHQCNQRLKFYLRVRCIHLQFHCIEYVYMYSALGFCSVVENQAHIIYCCETVDRMKKQTK